jgi:hypothetical protein
VALVLATALICSMPSMTTTIAATVLGRIETVGMTTIIAGITDGGIAGITAIGILIVGLGGAIVTIGMTTATARAL